MKKIFAISGAALFALSFGIAYAGGGMYNGVTDFTGKTHDMFELGRTGAANDTYEGSAAGSERERVTNNGSSVRNYDLFEIQPAPKAQQQSSSQAEGSAAGSLRRSFAGKESSVRTYDTFEIKR